MSNSHETEVVAALRSTTDNSQIALSVLNFMNKVVERSDDEIPINVLSSMIGTRVKSPSPRTTMSIKKTAGRSRKEDLQEEPWSDGELQEQSIYGSARGSPLSDEPTLESEDVTESHQR
ncbi:hypothetical protein BGZ65_001211 [Modicella reniformis]|uniref:Uncharacterized protein n=1 Tax=Modicella reniformis TaxID=1440133 RepID=A0A9P6MJQ4_9FUNG|nr:hypothetical protein BGZ65_001211 [Modicella reniformis]